jgi:hypothetical protein
MAGYIRFLVVIVEYAGKGCFVPLEIQVKQWQCQAGESLKPVLLRALSLRRDPIYVPVIA